MGQGEFLESRDEGLKAFIQPLSNTNFYNEDLNIVRIDIGGNGKTLFDIPLIHVPIETPHPSRHAVVVLTSKDFIDSNGLEPEKADFLPGVEADGSPGTLEASFGFLVSRRQRVVKTNPRSSSSTFSIGDVDFSDLNILRIALTPPTDRSYTNKEPFLGDKGNANIGVFMNNRVVMIKSHGGQITLGDEGVHIGGKVFWSDSKHGKEIMADNMFHGWIPQTTPTAAISIPYLINIQLFASIGEAGQKFINIAEKFKTAPGLFSGGVSGGGGASASF